jgi:hypothetical protein
VQVPGMTGTTTEEREGMSESHMSVAFPRKSRRSQESQVRMQKERAPMIRILEGMGGARGGGEPGRTWRRFVTMISL